MSKLCIMLPPLAPDYSGAASALFELGGMIVIHDASGCTGNAETDGGHAAGTR